MNLPRWRKLAVALILLAYFLYCNWDSLKVHFSSDEFFAMWTYWHGPWQLLAAQFKLWEFYFRPMAGIFYVPIFLKYGLDPVPYHVAWLFLLLAGAIQMYRFARVLGACELAAAATAFIACYHAGLSHIYFNTVFIGDAFCCLFYLGAFIYYAGIRAAGGIPTTLQTSAVLVLYLCALNSKETAATLPVVLLAYEWIYHGAPRWPWSELVRWIRGPGRVVLFTGLLNLLYVYSRAISPGALSRNPAYRLVFSRHRIFDFQRNSLGDLFLTYNQFDLPWVLGIWAVLTYLAFRRRRPILRFCWFYLVLSPIPIEFVLGRHGPYLYTMLAGWAVFVSVVLVDLIAPAAEFLSNEPLFRRIGRTGVTAMLVLLCGFLWARENHRLKELLLRPEMDNLSPESWDAIQQLQALHPRIRPGSQVVFLDDPFHNFDMAFIAELIFKDRSVTVRLNQATPLSPEQIAAADSIFTFENGKLVQLR
ncbi:MAG TPA: hypothetical protein VKU19_08070 [Bryobacteraceae bacterium]|nr:hypothetical protein [Bryobacteraceae bacterium]